MVAILGGQLPGAQAALQFGSAQRSVVVAIEPVKGRGCGRFCFAEVHGAVMIGVKKLQEASRLACREGLRSRACDAK